MLVGAPTEGSLFRSAGAVYLYRLIDGSWTQAAKFHGSEPFESAVFGWRLARDGKEFVVGSPAYNGALGGSAHQFSFTGGAHLDGASPAVGLASGGAQPMQIAACAEHAGDVYALLGSATGTGGGIPLGEAALPLVVDAHFAFTMTQPNNALLPASVGVLDAWGRADAAFVLPPAVDPALAGVTLHHAYVVLDWPTFEVELASNAIPVALVP